MRSRPSGCGLWFVYVVHADYGMEDYAAGEAAQGDLGIAVRTSGEDGELESTAEGFEQAGTRHPLFAQDQAALAVAEEDGLKVVLGGFEGDLFAGLFDDVVASFQSSFQPP